MSIPIDLKLYKQVKKLADAKFQSPSGIYRSSWIVKEYKKRGGKYYGKKSSNGLARWYKENWVNLNDPIRNSQKKIIGYHKCGRKSSTIKGKYPLCRPSKKISKDTPKTYKELSKNSIKNAKSLKKKYTFKKNISFTKSQKLSKKKSKKVSRKISKKLSKKKSKKVSRKRSKKVSRKGSKKISKKKSKKVPT
jgi:hypothetical protein